MHYLNVPKPGAFQFPVEKRLNLQPLNTYLKMGLDFKTERYLLNTDIPSLSKFAAGHFTFKDLLIHPFVLIGI